MSVVHGALLRCVIASLFPHSVVFTCDSVVWVCAWVYCGSGGVGSGAGYWCCGGTLGSAGVWVL